MKRRLARLAATVTLALCAFASARTVEIVQADRLELRKVDQQEIVVISGERVQLKVDEDVITATRVEYNRTRRTLTIVGTGTYLSHPKGPGGQPTEQLLRGSDLVVDLGSEALTGEDVLVSDAALEIRGEDVQRVPGQLQVNSGYFTPCARCGRTPNDYAFRAERILLYPGDRLVAYRATLLLADEPVLYLPVVVLPIGDPDRQPKFSVSRDATDGFTAAADLPFVIGSKAFGYSLLRYYQNRKPAVGFGVQLRAYAPLPTLERVDLYALVNPRPLPATGYEVDATLRANGRVPLSGSEAGLTYSVNLTRRDIGRTSTDPERGVTAVEASAATTINGHQFSVSYVDRWNRSLDTRLDVPLRLPEITYDPPKFTAGDLSADFAVTAGNYTAPSNPASRAATRQGPNISTTRLEERHTIAFTTTPWPDATFSVTNSFTGRYYGTGARVVDLNVDANLTQKFGAKDQHTFAVRYQYVRREGTSPFAFDATYGARVLRAPLSATFTLVPADGVTVTVGQEYDFFLPRDKQAAATFGVSLNRTRTVGRGVGSYTSSNTANLTVRPNLFTGDLEGSGSFSVTPARGVNVSGNATYNADTGLGPVTTAVTLTGATSADQAKVQATYNPDARRLRDMTFSVSGVGAYDNLINPVTLTATETLTFAQTGDYRAERASGSITLTWRDLALASTHSLTLPRGNPASDTLNFSVGSTAGAASSWNLTYGGNYDLARGGWPAPQLTARASATRPGQSIAARVTLNVPGLDQKITEVRQATLTANWDASRTFAVRANAEYNRSRTSSGALTERLTLSPVALTVALGDGPRPDAYVSTILNQELRWENGVLQAPGRLEPTFLVTVDRCCWALQAEINPGAKRFRVTLGLPGSVSVPAFEATPEGPRFPGLTQP